MTFTRLFRNSLGVATLAGFTLAIPLLAQIQPYNQNDQYGSPADQLAQQQDPQFGGPPNGAQQDNTYPQQYGAPQPGAPQGIEQAPPAIPDYEQPPAPGDGYIWTPGYWAWTADGYQWINGAWVVAPYSGALWTPGYWGFNDGYFWNAGYWGPYVGYYGGINYGFGYFGIGFYGGYWGGGRFYYNRAYCNIGRGWHGGNFYNRSYNGYSGHPGGASFTHVNSVAYHGGASNAYRGSNINGRSFAQTNAGRTTAQGFGDHSIRSTPGGAITSYNGARTYNGGTANAGRTYNGGTANAGRAYTGGTANYNANAGRAYNGGNAYAGGNAYGGVSRSYSQPAAVQSHSNYASAPHASYSGGGYSGGNYGGGSHGGGSYSGGKKKNI